MVNFAHLIFLEILMSAESVTQQPVTSSASVAARGRSTIESPYLDLDNALEIVKTIQRVEVDRAGWKQLATTLGVAPEGGGFRLRMLTAKSFGLLTYEKNQVMLTDLGIRANDPNFEKKARYDAFMHVELFQKLFQRFDGQPLPPIAALERAIENLGIAPKQKDKVRQIFLRSAKQAGLFELATDRLSTPPGLNATRPEIVKEVVVDKNEPQNDKGGGGNGGGGQYHPFIQGLLQKLPLPDAEWELKDRAKWLQTAANIFDLMYASVVAGEIEVKYLAKDNTKHVTSGENP